MTTFTNKLISNFKRALNNLRATSLWLSALHTSAHPLIRFFLKLLVGWLACLVIALFLFMVIYLPYINLLDLYMFSVFSIVYASGDELPTLSR